MLRYVVLVLSLLIVGAPHLARGRIEAQDGTVSTLPHGLVATVDHRFVPLATISTKRFIGEQLDETGNTLTIRVEETVMPDPATIDGFAATVVTVADYHNGDLSDTTADYFAQGTDGTVYYLGERVDEGADGTGSHDGGSWRSGDQGTPPGVFMPATPVVGKTFVLEAVPDVGLEQVTVIAVDQTVRVAAGTFAGCLVTKDISLPTGTTEEKTYCPAVGLVREDFLGGYLELVQVVTTA
jgi:hypothetical protein